MPHCRAGGNATQRRTKEGWRRRRRCHRVGAVQTRASAMAETSDISDIRKAVATLCARFPGEYWRALDRERAYPTEFVRALTGGGFLGCLIPEEFGGSGLGLIAAA